MERYDVVIAGAGHAGAHTALALRQKKFAGSILMIGRENSPPYERPPLSKEYLAREKTFERLYIRPPASWAEREVELRLGCEVVSVDPIAHVIALGDGKAVEYGSLVWATGGAARRLSCEGAGLDGVHTLRQREDIDQLMSQLDAGAREVTVIGGGFIGLEAAAVLTKLGCRVTVLESQERVLARVAGPPISEFYEREHRAHGVDLRTGVTVDRLVGEGGGVRGVRLGDGQVVSAQVVIVGIGIVPAVEPLINAGAKGSNGVLVDAHCRTSLADVYAIGDCAAHRSRFAGDSVVRIESVQNASEMAATTAKSICGVPEEHCATPWFWSNQYDLKLQTVGLSTGHDGTVVRGSPDARSFAVIYLRGGSVCALDCVNSAKDFVQGRKLVERAAKVEIEKLADPGIPLA